MTHSIPYLAIRLVAMPADLNSHGAIFGGWLLGIMDSAGVVTSRQYQHDSSKEDILTVSVSDMTFLSPVYVGDLVECWTTVSHLGNTSITIEIAVNAIRKSNQALIENVAKGTFKFVNTKNRKPTPIKK